MMQPWYIVLPNLPVPPSLAIGSEKQREEKRRRQQPDEEPGNRPASGQLNKFKNVRRWCDM